MDCSPDYLLYSFLGSSTWFLWYGWEYGLRIYRGLEIYARERFIVGGKGEIVLGGLGFMILGVVGCAEKFGDERWVDDEDVDDR